MSKRGFLVIFSSHSCIFMSKLCQNVIFWCWIVIFHQFSCIFMYVSCIFACLMHFLWSKPCFMSFSMVIWHVYGFDNGSFWPLVSCYTLILTISQFPIPSFWWYVNLLYPHFDGMSIPYTLILTISQLLYLAKLTV